MGAEGLLAGNHADNCDANHMHDCYNSTGFSPAALKNESEGVVSTLASSAYSNMVGQSHGDLTLYQDVGRTLDAPINRRHERIVWCACTASTFSETIIRASWGLMPNNGNILARHTLSRDTHTGAGWRGSVSVLISNKYALILSNFACPSF